MTEAVAGAKRMGFVESGDSIVLTAGMPLQTTGKTNLIRVITAE